MSSNSKDTKEFLSPLTRSTQRTQYEWERLHTALNHHAVVSITDARGNITYVNELFCQMSGFSANELIGQNHRIIRSDLHPPEFYQVMWSTLVSGNVWQGEVCNKRKNGELYWVESTITPFMDEEGKPYQFVSIRTDITAAKKHQESLLRRVKLQHCLTQTAQMLLSVEPESLESVIQETLQLTAACKSAHFAGFYLKDQTSIVLQDAWAAPNIDPKFTEEIQKFIDLSDANAEMIMQHQHYIRLEADPITHDLPQEYEYLKDAVAVPIFQQTTIVGYIVYAVNHECHEWRVDWTESLMLISNMLSNTLQRTDATKKLVRYKERLERGQHFAKIGTWEWDVDTQALYCSENIAPILNRAEGTASTTLTEVLNKVPKEDRKLIITALKKCLTDGAPYSVEHRVRWPNGDTRWILASGNVIKNTQGEVTQIVGIAKDIHERKLSQIKLQESEHELENAQQLAHLGSWKKDYLTGEVLWSKEIFNILKLPLNTTPLNFNSYKEMIHPEDLDRVSKIKDNVANIGNYELTFRVLRSDGSIRYIHEFGKPAFDKEGRLLSIIGTSQDVTQRIESEIKLADIQKRFSFAVEGAGDGIWDWNLNTGHFEMSSGYYTMLGYEPGELPPHIDSWKNKLHPEDLPRASKALADYLNNRIPKFHIEIRVRCHDHSYKWILCRGTVVEKSSRSRVLRMIGIHSDISKSKFVESELIKAHRSAEIANRAKSEFLSHMSHELRTPMNAILGFGQLMEYDPSLPEEHQESVQEILSAGKHLLTLINDILDLTKVEAGQMDLRLEPINLATLLKDTMKLLHPLAEQREISIELAEFDSLYVNADTTRLKQVFINLISNAIKYNVEQGFIKIYAEFKSSDHICIFVEDSGKGISSDALTHLFQPYQRLDFEYSNIEGSGIGLSLTKKIIELMNGSIGAESTLGRGSKFWVNIPLMDLNDPLPKTQTLGRYSSPLAHPTAIKTVLYIDDNTANIKLIKSILKQRVDVQFLEATTPELGISLVQNQQPDLILLDINMPELNGFEVLKHLREELNIQQPIVALTSNAMPQDIELGLNAGFSDYLTKPIDIAKFISVIDSNLLTTDEPLS